MNAHVLRGSKQEIAESLTRIVGEVREAIVFIDEEPDASVDPGEDIFAEMEPFTSSASGADYTREAIYTPMEGE